LIIKLRKCFGIKSEDVLQRLGYDLVAGKSVWIFPSRSEPFVKIKDFRLGNPSATRQNDSVGLVDYRYC